MCIRDRSLTFPCPREIANDVVTISTSGGATQRVRHVNMGGARLLRACRSVSLNALSNSGEPENLEPVRERAMLRQVREWLSVAAVAAVMVLLVGSGPVHAAWPERTITIIAHFAPGRFSTITVCWSTGPSSLAIRRASKSFDPPGAKWAMMVIVRSGHAACTGPLPTNRTITAATAATDNHSRTCLNMARSLTGSKFSGSPEFDSALSETLRQARSKRAPPMFTWRTRCVAPPLVDIVTTSFAISRGQGNVNDKAARRHQGYRAGQFHRRSVVRDAARRHGRRCHQSRAAERGYGAGDSADPQRRKRQLHRAQPQQAQPGARSQTAGSDGNSTQACGAVGRFCRSLSPE